MAGTDRSKAVDRCEAAVPAVILVRPQLGENIGAAARAMLNCGLDEMRLVAPRDGWPNPKAESMAVGAISVLENAKVYETTQDAVADLNLVLATTARSREQVKRAFTPRAAAAEMKRHIASGNRGGLLFGPERSGLENDEVALADAIVHVPLNPAFSSLNLAQAVLLLGYEWFQAGDETPDLALSGVSAPASVEDREYFLGRLEKELHDGGFLYPETLAPTIRRNIRNLFNRAQLTDQDVRTMHGVVSTLLKMRKRGDG
tara:strand:- start:1371 stop:2147 length:777 start_codon:yes stop_codon:yes gene_type:complete